MVDVAAGLREAVTNERGDVPVVLHYQNSHARMTPFRTSRDNFASTRLRILGLFAPREVLGLLARQLVDVLDRVTEAADLHRVELRVHAAARRGHADSLHELHVVAWESELDEIRAERRRPDDHRVVVDRVP